MLPGEKRFHLYVVMTHPQKRLESVLRRHGYRLTPQRRAVLRAISRSRDHLTPADLHIKVREDYPSVGLVTIYRTLDILNKMGLLCEVHSAGNGRSYFMRRPQGHHHHLVCSECGAVADFAHCDLGQLERRVAHETGYVVEGHLLELAGVCRNCQKIAVPQGSAGLAD
jgi:Fur family ferric uptake transcriptional regulator